MRINNIGADFGVGAQDGVGASRPPVASAGSSDEVVLSPTAKAVLGSGGYQTDSLLTADRIIDSALVKID